MSTTSEKPGSRASMLHELYYTQSVVPDLPGPTSPADAGASESERLEAATAAFEADWDAHTLVVSSAGMAPEWLAGQHCIRALRAPLTAAFTELMPGSGIALVIMPNARAASAAPAAQPSVARGGGKAARTAGKGRREGAEGVERKESLPKSNSTAHGVETPADIAAVVESALQLGCRGSHPMPPVHGIDEGATPEKRGAVYGEGGIVVAHARTLVTDLLCRRLSSALVRTAVVWCAEGATDSAAFVLALLRDLDRGSLRALAARGAHPPPRSVLSLTKGLHMRPEALQHLNPSRIRLLPRVGAIVHKWLAERPQAAVSVDTISLDAASRRCWLALTTIIGELLADLRRAASAAASHELLDIFLGGSGSMQQRRQTRANEAAAASNPRRAFKEKREREQQSEETRKLLPGLDLSALLTGQLDGVLSRLGSATGSAGAAAASSLAVLKGLATAFPVLSAAAFALRLDSALRVRPGHGGPRAVGQGMGAPDMPLWCLSSHFEEFVASAAGRVFCIPPAGGTGPAKLTWSPAIAGRLRSIRELIAGIVANATVRAPRLDDAASAADELLIVVGTQAAVADTVHALWCPTADALERHMFCDFVRQYRKGFGVDVDNLDSTESAGVPAALSQLVGADSDDSIVKGADDAGPGSSGDDSDGPDNGTAKGFAPSQLTATSSPRSQSSAHSMLLSLTSASLEHASPRRGHPETPHPPSDEAVDVDATSDDDGVTCVGEAGSIAVPLAPDDVLFPSAQVDRCADGEASLMATPGLRITVVHRRLLSLTWLLKRDPRSVIMVDPDVPTLTAIELFAASRGIVRGLPPDAASLAVRVFRNELPLPANAMATGVEPGAAGAVQGGLDWLKWQAQAERASIARLVRLRDTHVTQVTASGRARRAVENEIEWLSAARRRGPLKVSTLDRGRRPKKPVNAFHHAAAGDGHGGQSGNIITSTAPAIVFDMRELRASLPYQLFSAGLVVAPVTLITADYVLSPACALERKAPRDLWQSLNSGRLASQLRALEASFRFPVLLIEFGAKDKFSLATAIGSGGGADGAPVAFAKLSKVAMLHPRVSIVWSRNPGHSAEIVLELKASIAAENPDAADPALTQAPDATHRQMTQAACDMLLRLPGVNHGNAQRLMDACGSLAGLGVLSRTELQAALGAQEGASLHSFLHEPHRGARRPPRSEAHPTAVTAVVDIP